MSDITQSNRPLWHQNLTYGQVEAEAEKDYSKVVYNLHEDCLCLREELAVMKAENLILSNNIEALESDKKKLIGSWEAIADSELELREELDKEREALNSAQKVMDVYEKQKRALREEMVALKAENAKLNSVVCQTCYGAGSVCSAPDDCYNCPACTATYNSIRADAIRDMLTCIDGAIENDFISMREVEEMTLDDFFTLAKKHANKIEDGS